MTEKLRFEYGDKTVLELCQLYEQGHLNLEPGFQRKSVWTLADRRKLIQSVLENYPIPSIFLYRRDADGYPVYDVIDGKQRLETIFMFTRASRFKRHGFDVNFQFPDDDRSYRYGWKALDQFRLKSPVLTFKIQTVEVSGEISHIIDLFVRINSTGKALTSSEKRHARYFKSALLKEAERKAKSHRERLKRLGVISQASIDRMRDVELVTEIMASIENNGLIHKKAAVDKAVGNEAINGNTLAKVSRQFDATMKAVDKIFPDLRETRFSNVSEFYSLFMLVWEMDRDGMVLVPNRSDASAMNLLKSWSSGVDDVRELQRKVKSISEDLRQYANYLTLVQQSTDAINQRKARREILRGLLGGLFEGKDDRRSFTPEQRRLMWHGAAKPICEYCDEPLDWRNYELDHVIAHVSGGRTSRSNAALSCVSCNRSKGRRGRRRRRAA